jgi:hypothetical protein
MRGLGRFSIEYEGDVLLPWCTLCPNSPTYWQRQAALDPDVAAIGSVGGLGPLLGPSCCTTHVVDQTVVHEAGCPAAARMSDALRAFHQPHADVERTPA